MAVIPDKFKDLLQSKALAHVATIGPHGEPQSNPVWFGWDGEHILFSQTKNVRNIAIFCAIHTSHFLL